jgi:DUF4097 and DUF4098 domain-containing protein YvlB
MNQRLFLPLVIACVLAHAAPAAASTPINQSRPLAADGHLSVSNVSGRISITTWDQPTVQLTGSLGDGVEKLVVDGDARSLTIEVRYPEHDGGWFGGKRTRVEPTILVLKVPRRASLDLEAVSADIDVEGTRGRQLDIDSVSGDVRVTKSAVAEASFENVSGDLDLWIDSAQVDAETVSGDLRLHGALTGEIDVESVSGNIALAGRRLRRLEVSTVSGDADISVGLEPGASLSADTVSGTLSLALPANTGARLHAESFSGDIDSPVGRVETEDHGPGSSLDARMGDGKAEVRLESFSGDIRIRTQ